MFSLPTPPARRLMSLALSLIIPRLSSSFGKSALPARIDSFNFWLRSAISRSRNVAVLELLTVDADIVGAVERDGVEKAVVCGCAGVVDAGCVNGVEAENEGPAAGAFEAVAGVEGILPLLEKEEKALITN